MSRERFLELLDERLDQGAKEYGDRSFDRSELELLTELQQEALDLAGWSWVLFEKIERMKLRSGLCIQRCRLCGLTPDDAAGGACASVCSSEHEWRIVPL